MLDTCYMSIIIIIIMTLWLTASMHECYNSTVIIMLYCCGIDLITIHVTLKNTHIYYDIQNVRQMHTCFIVSCCRVIK